MTKEEIKALVKAKIAGQGTMVDVGGALPKVIDGIVDLIPKESAGLGLSGVYTEGGSITIPEGTFVILAAGDYTINVEDDIIVDEGHIDFYSVNDDGSTHYIGGITVGGSGPRVWDTGQTIHFEEVESQPTLNITLEPGQDGPKVGDVVTFMGTFEEAPEGEEPVGEWCECVMFAVREGMPIAQMLTDDGIVPITIGVEKE